MRCTHFRVLVTVLAAFGPFMAYVCRLNLSLIIEEMVVKSPSDETASNWRPAYSQPVSREHAELASRLPKISSEEQSLAELSAASWWLKNRGLRLKKNSTKFPPQIRKNQRINFIDQLRAQLLSIDVDVSPEAAKNRAGHSSSTGLEQAEHAEGAGTGTAPEVLQATTTGGGALLNWSSSDRNTLLGAFFWGYVVFQVPAGRAAEVFGPKLLFLALGLGTGLSSLLFPFASRWSDGIWFAYAIRFVMGASQAGLFPAVYVLLCRWLPKNERSSWLAVPSAMGRIGTIAMNFVVPIIMLNSTWEWVFFASGLVTLTWCGVFLVFGSDSPSTSAWISREELLHIESHMEPRVGSAQQQQKQQQQHRQELKPSGGSQFSLESQVGSSEHEAEATYKRPSINWLKMLRNRALLILTLVMFTSEWSNMLLLIKLPGFLGPALKMDLNEVGLWSSILVGIYCVQYPLAGVLASRLEAAEFEFFDSLRVRKLFELLAHTIQAASCLVIALFDDKTIVLTALVFMMLGRSTVGGGQCLMPPELSKDYPGSVMAVANSLANVAGIVGPYVVTLLVDEPTEYDAWRNVWLLSAGIFVLGGSLFCLLADNSPQNYCKKPKLVASKSTSKAQLVLPPYVPPPQMIGDHQPATSPQKSQQQQQQQRSRPHRPPQEPVQEEIVRMDAFARVSSEPARAKQG